MLSNTRAALVGMLSAWLRGHAVVSLPYPARNATAEGYGRQISRLLGMVDASSVYVEQVYVESMNACGLVASSLELLAMDLSAYPLDPLSPGDTHIFQATSGTIGEPKMVGLSGSALAANVFSFLDRLDIQEGDSLCSWLPWSHDMGLIGMCLGAWVGSSSDWASGGAAHFLRPEEVVARPSLWLRAMEEMSVTVTASPPFMLDVVTRGRAMARLQKDSLSSLRKVLVGSATIPPNRIGRAVAAFGACGTRKQAFVPAYGLAEATLAVSIGMGGIEVVRPPVTPGISTQRSIDADARQIDAFASEVVLCGPPVSGVEIRIDSESAGGIGEICVQSPSLGSVIESDGVMHRVESLHTGDIGFMWDGQVGVIGRGDDRMKVGTRTVVAAQLAELAKEECGESLGLVSAFVDDAGRLCIIGEESCGTASGFGLATQRRVRARIADATGTVVSRFLIVRSGSVPRTPSGKVQRLLMCQQLRDENMEVIAEWS